MDNLTESENRLVSRLREEHRQIYAGLKSRMEAYLLDFAAMHIRYFTNHGRKHFLGVIQQMSEMMPDEVLNTLSSSEALILLCCAWLHDIGLMVNVDSSGRLLTDSEIRDAHPALGRDLIRSEHHELGLDDRVLAGLIADVGYCHSRKGKSISDYLEPRDILGTDIIRPQFLAAVLRLADALDTDSRRAPALLLQRIAHFPDQAQLHWEACQMMNVSYDCQEGIIRVHAVAPVKGERFLPDEYKSLFFWKFADLYEEFIGVKDLLVNQGIPYREMIGMFAHFSGSEKQTIKITGSTLIEDEIIPSDVILYDHYQHLHEDKHEYIFAADWCFQAGRVYERRNNLERARVYYAEAAAFVKKHRQNETNDRYWSNLLESYFQAKSQFLNREPPEEQKKFLRDMDTILRQLDLLEENLSSIFGEKEYEALYLLLKIGHSPLRHILSDKTKALGDHLYQKITLDNDCPYCTGFAFSVMGLAKEDGRFGRTMEWLCNQESHEWRLYQKKPLGYNNTAIALLGLMNSNNNLGSNLAAKAFELLLDPETDWDCDRDNPRTQAQALILTACGEYWQSPKLRKRKKYSELLQSRIKNFIEVADHNRYDMASGLRAITPGILLGAELLNTARLWKEIGLDSLFDTTYRDMKAIGTSGTRLISSNPERTMHWLWGWISYWHYELIRRQLVKQG